jgi:murein DD-endopeptidase MepM/ murein hydrolase activator NlpD
VLFFILVGAVGIFMLLMVTRVINANYVLEIEKTLYVSLEMEDKGTELISLLNSNKTGMKYMEVIGGFSAENHAVYIDDQKTVVRGTLLKIRSGGYSFYVLWPGGSEKLEDGNMDCSGVLDKDLILIWPVIGSNVVSSPYMENRGDHLHGGIDIPGDGLSVVAAADGEVVAAGWEDPTDHSQGFGLRVTIKHTLPGDKYYYTIYGHLSEIKVSEGERVTRGQEIGRTGNTGYSTGSHLHFELADGPLISRNSINVCPYVGNPYGCAAPDAPDVSVGVYGTEIPLPGAQEGMLKGEVEFLC